MEANDRDIANQEYLVHWTALVRATLADIFVRGEFDDFGIFRFLNRVTFISTKQICFVFLDENKNQFLENHKSEKKHIIINPNISVRDGTISESLFNYLLNNKILNRNIQDIQSAYWLDRDLISGFTYDLFDTTFKVMLLQLDVNHINPGHQPDLNFTPVTTETLFGKFIHQCFQPFDGKEGRQLFEPAGYLDYNLRKLSERSTLKSGNESSEEIDGIAPYSEDRNFIMHKFQAIKEMVDSEYLRLKKSPLISKKLNIDGNLIDMNKSAGVYFFSKLFVRNSKRYRRYSYDSQIVLSSTQKSDILSDLESAVEGNFIPYFNNNIFSDKLNKDYDEWFWQLAASNPEQIIDILEGEIPQHVRTFTENVFRGGTTMVKPSIFAHGSIGWIDQPEKLSDAEITKCYEYLVCLHYLLQLGFQERAPRSAKNLSIVAYPFRCSGGIWMCAVHLRENIALKSDDSVLSHDSLNTCFGIYHFLLKQTERRFRTKAREMFAKELGEIIAQAIANTRRRRPEGEVGIDGKGLRFIEKYSRLLARLYPYECLNLGNGTSINNDEFVPLDSLAPNIIDNPFFDRLTLRSFLKEEALKEIITDQAINYLYRGAAS